MVLDVSKITFGVDLASHQGILSVEQWKSLHQDHGICYAICKSTGETSYFNPTYFPNRDNVRALNAQLGYTAIQWGSYDWFEPSMAGVLSGKAAARDYLSAIGPRDPKHLLMVDFESEIWDQGPLGQDIHDYCNEYAMTLSEESGQLVGFYFGPYFMTATGARHWDWLGDKSRFFCWLAAPGPNAQSPDNIDWPGNSLALPFNTAIIHQHQWHTHFPAVPGTEWDKNRFQGTPEQLWVYGNQGSVVVPEKPVMIPLPPDGRWSDGITADNVPYVVWNIGGKTKRIDGIAIKDMGASVESFTEDGMILDRSIFNNEIRPYNPPRPKV